MARADLAIPIGNRAAVAFMLTVMTILAAWDYPWWAGLLLSAPWWGLFLLGLWMDRDLLHNDGDGSGE